MCRHSWIAWLLGCAASFAVLEMRGFKRGCHRTLSRELQTWTGCKRHPWTVLVFVALGGWLSAHLATLKDLEQG
jgi:hypothetical protein